MFISINLQGPDNVSVIRDFMRLSSTIFFNASKPKNRKPHALDLNGSLFLKWDMGLKKCVAVCKENRNTTLLCRWQLWHLKEFPLDDIWWRKKDEKSAEVLLDIYYLGMRSILKDYFYFYKLKMFLDEF